MDPSSLQPPLEAIAGLLARAQAPGERLSVERIPGGRNNRVYRVTAANRTYFLKQYFRHPADARDRFAAETAFMSFCNHRGLAWVPRLLATDSTQGLALMEFIDGSRITTEGLIDSDVDQALAFFADLNRSRELPEAGGLPFAADMRASVRDQISLVEERVAKLDQIAPDGSEGERARSLVKTRLRPLWQSIRDRAAREATALQEDPLPRERHVISPSDFGFHNALRREDGRICFVDFEYAGWDDPAKTLADFFLQPAVPPPVTRKPDAERVIAEAAGNFHEFALRARLLQPVFAIKWCCILLNEFMPVDADRRTYAQPDEDRTTRRRAQLERLCKRLDALEQETAAT
jgi:hypothetical protein